jgi:hypothetical protein
MTISVFQLGLILVSPFVVLLIMWAYWLMITFTGD